MSTFSDGTGGRMVHRCRRVHSESALGLVLKRVGLAAISVVASLPSMALLGLFALVTPAMVSVLAGMVKALANVLVQSTHTGFWFIDVALFVTGVLLGRMLGTIAGRYVLQLAPINASGTCRAFGVFLIFLMCFYAVVGVVVLVEEYSGQLSPDRLGDTIHVAALTSPTFVSLLTLLGLLIRWYASKRPRPESYLLFLRRFGSFSDQEVIASVMRAASGLLPVVMLVGTRRTLGNWDPTVAFLSGQRWLNPLWNNPWYYRAQDHNWERVVRRLLRGASVIVIDGSDRSSSISREVEMIAECGAAARTLWLSDSRTSNIDGVVGRIVPYERRWRWSMRRVLLLSVLFSWTLAATLWLLNVNILEFDNPALLVGWAPIMGALLAVVLVAASSRPGVSPSVAAELKSEIQQRIRTISVERRGAVRRMKGRKSWNVALSSFAWVFGFTAFVVGLIRLDHIQHPTNDEATMLAAMLIWLAPGAWAIGCGTAVRQLFRGSRHLWVLLGFILNVLSMAFVLFLLLSTDETETKFSDNPTSQGRHRLAPE